MQFYKWINIYSGLKRIYFNIHTSLFLKIWIHFNLFQFVLVCYVVGNIDGFRIPLLGMLNQWLNLIEINRPFLIPNSVMTSFIHFLYLSLCLKYIHLSLSNILQRHLLEDRTPTARHNYCFIYHPESSLSIHIHIIYRLI